MPGRRPKPMAIHKLNGNPSQFSKAELAEGDAPQPELIAPEMPKGLDGAARREWRRIVPRLLEIGVLSQVDGRALAAYCDAASMVEKATKEITKHGLTFVEQTEDKYGNIITLGIKANPAVSIKFNAMKVMKTFLIEFGLTPASRRNLKIKKKDDGDAMDKFMKGKRPGGPIEFAPPAPIAPEAMIDTSDIKTTEPDTSGEDKD